MSFFVNTKKYQKNVKLNLLVFCFQKVLIVFGQHSKLKIKKLKKTVKKTKISMYVFFGYVRVLSFLFINPDGDFFIFQFSVSNS